MSENFFKIINENNCLTNSIFKHMYENLNNYCISKDGEVKTVGGETLNKFIETNQHGEGGYNNTYRAGCYYVILNKQRHFIHRLVADFYIHDPNNNKGFIIHMDGNKLNNNIDNLKRISKLEWGKIDRYTCQCGINIRTSDQSKHIKSKNHIDYLNRSHH